FKYKIAENPSILEGVIIILLSIVLSLLMTIYIEAPIINNKINKKAFKLILVMLAINLLLVIALSIIHFSHKSNMDKPINTKDYPGVNAIFKQLNVKE